MISHRSVMVAAGAAVRDSEAVLEYCLQHFGRGLAVHVGAYEQCVPSTKEAPFLWIIPKEENDEINEDKVFTVMMCVGGLVTGPDGEKVITNVNTPRTDAANGLTVNGGNAIVEDLRDIIIGVVRNAKAGARVRAIRREENDLAHFPLEWATIFIEYFEPEAL